MIEKDFLIKINLSFNYLPKNFIMQVAKSVNRQINSLSDETGETPVSILLMEHVKDKRDRNGRTFGNSPATQAYSRTSWAASSRVLKGLKFPQNKFRQGGGRDHNKKRRIKDFALKCSLEL